MQPREGITGIDIVCGVGAMLIFGFVWAQNIENRTKADIFAQQARDLVNQKQGMYEGAILRGK